MKKNANFEKQLNQLKYISINRQKLEFEIFILKL